MTGAPFRNHSTEPIAPRDQTDEAYRIRLVNYPTTSLWRLASQWDQEVRDCQRRGDEAGRRLAWGKCNAVHVELNRRECAYRALVRRGYR